jgi:hypothetical protein
MSAEVTNVKVTDVTSTYIPMMSAEVTNVARVSSTLQRLLVTEVIRPAMTAQVANPAGEALNPENPQP